MSEEANSQVRPIGVVCTGMSQGLVRGSAFGGTACKCADAKPLARLPWTRRDGFKDTSSGSTSLKVGAGRHKAPASRPLPNNLGPGTHPCNPPAAAGFGFITLDGCEDEVFVHQVSNRGAAPCMPPSRAPPPSPPSAYLATLACPPAEQHRYYWLPQPGRGRGGGVRPGGGRGWEEEGFQRDGARRRTATGGWLGVGVFTALLHWFNG